MATSEAESDFEFYLRFVKPLIFNLQEPEDRVLAAAWVQKLMNKNSGTDDLRTCYLKLLLFVLQRKKLRGIFLENPNQVQGLDQFSEANLHEVARDLLTAEKKLQESPESGDFPPYSTEHSADLLEYSAVQYIPNFGVHAYYAISNEPLPTWNRTEKAVFPKGIIRRSTTQIKVISSRVTLTESAPSLDEQSLFQKNKTIRVSRSSIIGRRSNTRRDRSKHFDNMLERDHQSSIREWEARRASPRITKMANVPLAQPLGANIEQSDEEGRDVPMWGSNLIRVSEPPIWETAPDLLETESEYMQYQPDSDSYSSSLYGDLPYQTQSPRSPNRQEPCVPDIQDARVPCVNPIPQKRPVSAAPPKKENSYNYQANYYQAVPLSNLGVPFRTGCIPCSSPPHNRQVPVMVDEVGFDVNQKLHDFEEREMDCVQLTDEIPAVVYERGFNFDIPSEGSLPRGQVPLQIDERNFELNQRPFIAVSRRGKTGFVGQRAQTPVQIHDRDINKRLSRFEISVGDEMQVVQPNNPMHDSDFALLPNYILPPVAEREQEHYNFDISREGLAEIERIIKQSTLNTKRIDEDLAAFDRFIREYEKADLGV